MSEILTIHGLGSVLVSESDSAKEVQLKIDSLYEGYGRRNNMPGTHGVNWGFNKSFYLNHKPKKQRLTRLISKLLRNFR